MANVNLTDEQLADVKQRALRDGFWTLTADEMAGYRQAWREGRAEEWRATAGIESKVEKGRIVYHDTFGVTGGDCAKKLSSLLAQLGPGAGVITDVHQAFYVRTEVG